MNVACPSCGEQGKISRTLIGHRIKCLKCAKSFVVTDSDAPPPAAFDPTDPFTTPVEKPATAEAGDPDASAPAADQALEPVEPAPSFAEAPAEPAVAGAKQYKVLTQKDKWFEGRFELGRLEEALNHYARQGWVVRSMATPHVAGFSGGPREELVVLLER